MKRLRYGNIIWTVVCISFCTYIENYCDTNKLSFPAKLLIDDVPSHFPFLQYLNPSVRTMFSPMNMTSLCNGNTWVLLQHLKPIIYDIHFQYWMKKWPNRKPICNVILGNHIYNVIKIIKKTLKNIGLGTSLGIRP